jgi:hypothetical protein
MALPKIEAPGGRFTIKAILRDIEGKLKRLFAPLDLKPPKRKEPEYKGAPGPSEEWEYEEITEKPVGRTELADVSATKGFPEKKINMETKRMHAPRVQKPKLMRENPRRKLQKNL